MTGKTVPELDALSAPVVSTDVVTVYRSPGPLKRTTATALADFATTFTPQTTTPAVRSLQTKAREQAISQADSAAATTPLKIQDAVSSAQNGIGYTFLTPGSYTGDLDLLDTSEEMRGKSVTILGSGTGEPFVVPALQEGTRLAGSNATAPVVTLNQNAAQQGSGSVDFGKLFVSGTKNTTVPLVDVEGLQGINFIREIGMLQSGAGDGLRLGNVTTSTVRDVHSLGASWVTAPPTARTGTGVEIVPDQDNGLGWLHKITSRGWQQSFKLGQASGTRLLGYTVSQCEVSYCNEGFSIGAATEGLHLETPYVEGCDGTAVTTAGKATLVTNPYAVLGFTTGVSFGGSAGTLIGGYIGLRSTGATGVTFTAASGGGSLFGTQILWGGGGLGGTGTGINIAAQANPVVALFPQYTGSWGGGNRLVDSSYSAEHGGSGGGNGSGAIGYLERVTAAGEQLPCLSRGAVNLRVDGTDLVAGSINISGTLSLSAASVQQLYLASATTAIVRFTAPNLPDKTGVILITNGYAQFSPGFYMTGIDTPVIFGAGETGAIFYQTLPGANAIVRITNVFRSRAQVSTVAALPSAATAAVGAKAFVSDALAPVFGATVAGGGAVATPVYSDGTNWKVG